MEVEETHRYGVVEPADSSEAWWRIYDLSPGPNGGVLVCDIGNHRVDLVVRVIVTFGAGQGAGPGELSGPNSAAFDGNSTVYVSEYDNVRVSVFEASGRFIRIIRTGHVPGMIAAGNNNDLWVGRSWNATVDAVDRVDPYTGEIIASLGGRYRDEAWFRKISYRSFLASSVDGILASTFYPYELIEYDGDAKIRRIISREVDWLTPPEPLPEIPEAMDLRGGMVRQIGVFPDGSIAALLVRKHWQGNDLTSEFFLDVFTREGEWLTTAPVSTFGKNLHIQIMTIASDGALWLCYYTDEGTPFIVRYRVNWR